MRYQHQYDASEICWATANLGWRIFKYSPSAYLKLWRQVVMKTAKFALTPTKTS